MPVCTPGTSYLTKPAQHICKCEKICFKKATGTAKKEQAKEMCRPDEARGSLWVLEMAALLNQSHVDKKIIKGLDLKKPQFVCDSRL